MGSALPLDVLTADIAERPNAYHSDWKNLELMQYTGLKDKNGTEIYEGDVVFFEGASFRCEFQSGGFVFNFANYEKDCFNFVVEDSKVIGNIYKNPELLQQE